MCLGIAGCLLVVNSSQASAASIIAVTGDEEIDLLASSARPTLDTESVLQDLATGQYYGDTPRSIEKRGPWRKVGRMVGRIAKYGPLAGVVGPRKNMKKSTAAVVALGICVAGGAFVAAFAISKGADLAKESLR